MKNFSKNAGALLRLSISAIPSLILVAIVASINPFGIKSVSELASIDIFLNIVSPLYPDKSQSKIAVVLIDDKSLTLSNSSFPPRFSFYGRIVNSIDTLGAKRIFFSMNFFDKRGEDEELYQFSDLIKQTEFFINSPPSIMDQNNCTFATDKNLPQISSSSRGEPHPMVDDSERHFLLTIKDLCMSHNDTGRANISKDQRNSAALELYTQYCKENTECADSENDPLKQNENFVGKKLTIEWGSAPQDYMEDLSINYLRLSKSCQRPGWRQLIENIFLNFQVGYAETNTSYGQVGCFYHPVIRAEWLLFPESFNINTEDLMKIISGSTVLVGPNFSSQNSFLNSATFGKVPSVFLHAMALDNLMTHGKNFLHPWEKTGIGDLGYDGVAEILIIFSFSLFGKLFLLAKNTKSMSEEIKNQRAYAKIKHIAYLLKCLFAVYILSIFSGMIISAIFFYFFRLEPVNWIGIFIACLTVANPALRSLETTLESFITLGDTNEQSTSRLRNPNHFTIQQRFCRRILCSCGKTQAECRTKNSRI